MTWFFYSVAAFLSTTGRGAIAIVTVNRLQIAEKRCTWRGNFCRILPREFWRRSSGSRAENPRESLMQKRAWKLIGMALAGCGLWGSVAIVRANGRAAAVATGASEIGGAVASAKGPEAGVWVIAETSDLGTKFRKIVVTDDRGQFLLPELPKANYKVWVRGYGLVDSEPVDATPGKTLTLAAVVAPTAAAAAQYYPASYWAVAAERAAEKCISDDDPRPFAVGAGDAGGSGSTC